MAIGDMPEWSIPMSALLKNNSAFDVEVDQMIINEYQPAQGIVPNCVLVM